MPKGSTPLQPPASDGKPESRLFSHLLAVDAVPDLGLDIKLCASEGERAMLSAQCGVVAVKSFEADLNVRRRTQARFNVSGNLEALVTQTCVITLEPFDTIVRADIDVDFAPRGEPSAEALERKKEEAGPSALAFSDEEPPDPITNGQIDLGALAAEFLVLNLDLYPRKPGATFEETHRGGEPEEKESPFAVLRRKS